MTNSEYVGLTVNERRYGQENFLQAQLELLNLVKGIKGYRKLRGEEFVLKVALKSKIEEMLSLADKLEKLLPRTEYGERGSRKEKKEKKVEENLSLQGEIDRIKTKLARLRGGM